MENFKFVLDPTGHFTKRRATKDKLVAACGFLPAFCLGDAPTLAENLTTNYQFFMGWTPPGSASVDDRGRFLFPEDEPQYPILKVSVDGEIIYIYQYAIVAHMVNDEFVGWTRMD